MDRYLKVKGVWVDTLHEQHQGLTYMVIDGVVSVMDKDGNETTIGKLEDTCDGRSFVDCRECPKHGKCDREKQLIQWWEQDMAMNEGGSLD